MAELLIHYSEVRPEMNVEAPSKPSLYRLLAVAGYQAYMNSLVGNPAPRVDAYNKRIRHPDVGDLVVETSTIWFDDWNTAAIGWLRGIAHEPVQTEEEHAAMLAEGDYWENAEESYEAVPLEKVWYVEPLDPDAPSPFRWHNADFVALPTDLSMT